MEITLATRNPWDRRYGLCLCLFAGSEGIIRWKGQRYAKPETERELFETAKALI